MAVLAPFLVPDSFDVPKQFKGTRYQRVPLGPASLMLRVNDDGCGFDIEKTIPLGAGHFALIGMRERAERIGASFTPKSRPGEGTEIRVEVPASAMGER